MKPVGCFLLAWLVVMFEVAASWLVQALWNWLLPSLVHVSRITMLQAFGILLLCSLLTGGLVRSK